MELVRELSEVRKQKDARDWDANFFGSAEEKELFVALEHVERDLRAEMATLTARLREYSDVKVADE